MNTNSINNIDFELDMIKNDTNFYVDLPRIAKLPGMDTISFALFPYMSMYVTETNIYSKRNLTDFYAIAARKHKNFIDSARIAAKLFDETKRTYSELTEEIEWIVDQHYKYLMQDHVSDFAWRKHIQTDLGIYLFNEHIYATSHSASFNLGLVKDNLANSDKEFPLFDPQLMRQVSYEIGEYITLLRKHLKIPLEDVPNATFKYPFKQESFSARDVFSNKYYVTIFNGTGPWEVNFYLLTFLATINSLRFIFKNLVIGTPVTLLKIKYISLYHAIKSLEKLQDNYNIGILTDRSTKFLDEIISHPISQKLTEDKVKPFRNIIVHYGINKSLSGIVDKSIPLYGLIEHFFDEMSFHDLDVMLDTHLNWVGEL